MSEHFQIIKKVNPELGERVDKALDAIIPPELISALAETLNFSSQQKLLAGLQAIEAELRPLAELNDPAAFTNWALGIS